MRWSEARVIAESYLLLSSGCWKVELQGQTDMVDVAAGDCSVYTTACCVHPQLSRSLITGVCSVPLALFSCARRAHRTWNSQSFGESNTTTAVRTALCGPTRDSCRLKLRRRALWLYRSKFYWQRRDVRSRTRFCRVRTRRTWMAWSFRCSSARNWCTAASCCFMSCRLSFSSRRSSSSLAARS